MVSILLTGIATLDIVHTLDTYPGADDEVRAASRRISCGGNAANSANVLAQLGHEVSLACLWADDLIAAEIRTMLSQRNIHLPIDVSVPGQSPLSCVTLSAENHSRNIIHYRDLPELDYSVWQQITPGDYQWFHFEGRHPDHTAMMMQAAREANGRISLELEKPRDGLERLIPLADVVLFSRPFAEAMGFATARECLEHYANNHDGIFSCTWGHQGAWIHSQGQMYHAQTHTDARIVDTLGAGDTYNAGLIHGIATGMGIDQALDFATRLATTKITQTGLDQLVKPMPIKLCHVNELQDPDSRGFTLVRNGREFLMFLVKKDGMIYGYENRCPHAGVNLEWREDDFLDMDKALIQCSVHGALFTIDSGNCVAGPCNGRGLTPVKLEQGDDGFLYLHD